MVQNNRKTVNLYEEAKASLNSVIEQIATIFIGFVVLLFITGGAPSNFVVALSFCLGTAFVAWSEQNRIEKLRTPVQMIAADLNPISEFDQPEKEDPLTLKPDGTQTLNSAPSLDELINGNLINQLMDTQKQQKAKLIEHYINTDPDGHLKANFPIGYPNCHYQLLAQRLILKEPPDRVQVIANEFGIRYSKLHEVVTGKDPMSLYNLILALLKGMQMKGYTLSNDL